MRITSIVGIMATTPQKPPAPRLALPQPGHQWPGTRTNQPAVHSTDSTLGEGLSAQVNAAIALVDQLHALNADDTALLRLIARWAPYGTPPGEDVYVTFGLNGQQACRRVVDILTRCPRRSAARRFAVTLTRLLGTPNATPALDDWRRRLDTATTTSRPTLLDPHSRYGAHMNTTPEPESKRRRQSRARSTT